MGFKVKSLDGTHTIDIALCEKIVIKGALMYVDQINDHEGFIRLRPLPPEQVASYVKANPSVGQPVKDFSQEVKFLRDQLDEKNKKIEELAQDNVNLLAEIDKLKSDADPAKPKRGRKPKSDAGDNEEGS